jgi:hypothetical protein
VTHESRLDHPAPPAGAPRLVHALITLTAPDAPTGFIRPGLNVAAVIDRRGSMAGTKLEYAKLSVRVLVEQLGPRERFSLLAFDDPVLPLIEGVRTGDKTLIQAGIAQIECGGSTNLSGGWIIRDSRKFMVSENSQLSQSNYLSMDRSRRRRSRSPTPPPPAGAPGSGSARSA